MGFLDDLIAKGKALITKASPYAAPPPGEHTDAIIHDRFDTWTWDQIRRDVPAIERELLELAQSHDYVASFLNDQFNLLHQGDPMFRDKNDMDERYQTNLDLSRHFADMGEMKTLRMSTMHDRYATAMAMLAMKDAYREAYEHAAEAHEAQKKAIEERERLQEMLDQLGDMLTDPNADPNAIEDLMGQIEAQYGITIDTAVESDQAADAATAQAGLALRGPAKQAAQDMEQEKQMLTSFGVEDGVLQRMDFNERRHLAEKLKHLERFAQIIGAMKNVEVGESRRRIIHAPDQISGVELSDDVLKLTSGELMNLADPTLEADFWRRFASHELQVYQLRGVEKLGKGPIIYIADESGSMSGAGEQWSKAMLIGLCDRARRDGRDFTYIGFSSRSQMYRVDFPGGKYTLDQLIDVVSHFFGGGTHYEQSLSEAAGIVEQAHLDGKPKPDVVFVTDDAYHSVDTEFAKEWNRIKELTDMRCYGILVGSPGRSGALDAVADNVRTIEDLTNLESVRDIFRTV